MPEQYENNNPRPRVTDEQWAEPCRCSVCGTVDTHHSTNIGPRKVCGRCTDRLLYLIRPWSEDEDATTHDISALVGRIRILEQFASRLSGMTDGDGAVLEPRGASLEERVASMAEVVDEMAAWPADHIASLPAMQAQVDRQSAAIEHISKYIDVLHRRLDLIAPNPFAPRVQPATGDDFIHSTMPYPTEPPDAELTRLRAALDQITHLWPGPGETFRTQLVRAQAIAVDALNGGHEEPQD